VEQENSIECELIDRELKELQSLAGIPKAGGEAAVERVEELAALIKVRQLVASLRNFLQTRSEYLQKQNLAVLTDGQPFSSN